MRDSHGLFDYESKSINKRSLKTSTNGKIVRLDNDIEFYPISKSESELPTNAQTLLQIKNDKSILINFISVLT